jgi:hypothetical protein
MIVTGFNLINLKFIINFQEIKDLLTKKFSLYHFLQVIAIMTNCIPNNYFYNFINLLNLINQLKSLIVVHLLISINY